jgi:large subunit ribosomal protein L19
VEDVIKKVEKKFITDKHPSFAAGDTVQVSMNIIECGKERVQAFKGTVVQIRGTSLGKTFTVRKVSGGVYVERIFPYHSPLITEIRNFRKGRVRRAKLFYLRDLSGKSTRIREQQN